MLVMAVGKITFVGKIAERVGKIAPALEKISEHG
jgi:hypothetical protein